MAFWKKSEDPWDIDPSKKRRNAPVSYTYDAPAEEEERGSLLETVKQWGEKLNAAVSEETLLPAEVCPRCGKEMVQGYVTSDRGILWVPGAPSIRKKWIGPKQAVCLRVDDEGALYTYKTAWHCPDCQWMQICTAGMTAPYDAAEPVTLDLGEGGEEEEADGILEEE